MSDTNTNAHLVARRAELMVELFLQDIGATLVSKPVTDVGYDFVVGFPNSSGGINLSAIEVKATENPVAEFYPLPVRWYKRLAHANVPGLLLVVDAKRNRIYHAWPWPKALRKHRNSGTIQVPVIEVDDEVKKQIHQRLSGRAEELQAN
jgi:hypothetical protein